MFITKSRHEAEISVWRTDLKRANEARDNWRDSSKEWEAKFKTAISDLEQQTQRAEYLETQWERDRPDALLWRNAREKRAKNRGGGK